MSETDKTGEKLAASMRRTRAGAAQESSAARKTAPAPRKKTAAGSATASAARKTKEAAPGRDPYQAGRRIWPD